MSSAGELSARTRRRAHDVADRARDFEDLSSPQRPARIRPGIRDRLAVMAESQSSGDLPVSALVGETSQRISPDASLFEVASTLSDVGLGALVVGDGDRPAGVISERDLVEAMAKRLPFDTTKAIDVATTELVWCDATATVAEVAEEMFEHYIRHVLVEEDGRLLGVVSARDLLGVYVAGEIDLEP